MFLYRFFVTDEREPGVLVLVLLVPAGGAAADASEDGAEAAAPAWRCSSPMSWLLPALVPNADGSGSPLSMPLGFAVSWWRGGRARTGAETGELRTGEGR